MSETLRKMLEFYTDKNTGKEYEVIFHCLRFNYYKPEKGLVESSEALSGYVDAEWDYEIEPNDGINLPEEWVADKLGELEQELIKEVTGQYDQYSCYDDFEEDQLEAWFINKRGSDE